MGFKTITISREYGSGGHEIARMVGDRLGRKVYDKNLVAEVAKQSGLTEDYVERSGEHASKGNLFFNTSGVNGYRFSQSDQIYILQTKIIKEVAQQEPCIVVGRCADYVLRDYPECLHIFIHAPKEFRADRVVKFYGISADAVAKTMKRVDKERKSFYEYYTEKPWGMASNYSLTLDTSVLGLDACVDLICSLAE